MASRFWTGAAALHGYMASGVPVGVARADRYVAASNVAPVRARKFGQIEGLP